MEKIPPPRIIFITRSIRSYLSSIFFVVKLFQSFSFLECRDFYDFTSMQRWLIIMSLLAKPDFGKSFRYLCRKEKKREKWCVQHKALQITYYTCKYLNKKTAVVWNDNAWRRKVWQTILLALITAGLRFPRLRCKIVHYFFIIYPRERGRLTWLAVFWTRRKTFTIEKCYNVRCSFSFVVGFDTNKPANNFYSNYR